MFDCVLNTPLSLVVGRQPPEVFCKKGILRNFVEFTGKHLPQSFFFLAYNFIKMRLPYMCLPVNFAKFLRTLFLTEHLRWLLLAVNKVCFDGESISQINKNLKRYWMVQIWYMWRAMDKSVECLCCDEVEAVEYFEFLVMRWDAMIWMQSLREFKVFCEIVHF